MLRRLPVFAALALALVLAPAALAGGPNPAGLQQGAGALLPGSTTRYVAVAAGSDTLLEALRTTDGRVTRSLPLSGAWGLATVGRDPATAGISRDGRTLVLTGTQIGRPTSFTVVDTKPLRVRSSFTLRGTYAFDALSPYGSRLYLIQYAGQDYGRYVVRAYDLRAHRLLPGRIADRTQKSWVMQGFPASRTSSPDGRWVYTLYANPGGYPFVHALDTVRGVAHCTGVPWTGSESAPWNMRLALRDGGRSLAVNLHGGRTFAAIDTRTWRVSYARAHTGAAFPWRWLGIAAGGVAALSLAAGVLLLRRRRRDQELEQELVHLVGRAEREVVV